MSQSPSIEKEKEMKKKSLLFIVLAIALVIASLTGCAPKTTKPPVDAWKWIPGPDEVVYKSAAADDWSPTFTIYLRIVGAEETVLYDGKVTLTSPQMMANEFLAAAINSKGLAQEGLDVGFITKIGDYENDTTTNTYWMFYVNGEMPNWGTNEYRLRHGDYVELKYEAYKM